jgi:hypothetical protein
MIDQTLEQVLAALEREDVESAAACLAALGAPKGLPTAATVVLHRRCVETLDRLMDRWRARSSIHAAARHAAEVYGGRSA